MAKDQGANKDREVEETDDLIGRFPAVPKIGHVPEAPRLAVQLPPHPDKPKPGSIAPGSYGNMAVAATAASSFIMPVLVLSVGGYYIDQKLHHQTAWFAMAGLVIGMVAGISALMRVISKLSG